MNCRSTERWILESLDRDLAPGPRRDLEGHLRACPACRARRAEFVALRDDLGRLPMPALRPGFAGRVGARIEALSNPAAAAPAALWRTCCLRAIPVSLFLIGLFVGGLVFLPGGGGGLSQAEALLLNETARLETPVYFDETKKPEENTMMILLTAAETTAQRRPRP